jgi:hypothetical protein
MEKYNFLSSVYISIIAIFAGFSNSSSATTITFDGLVLPTDTFSYFESGVTFTAVNDGPISTQLSPNGTTGLRAVEVNPPSIIPELRADFAVQVSYVAVDLGDFGGSDNDLLFLEAFDSLGDLIDSTSLQIFSSGMWTLSLSLATPDISYVVFGARAPSARGSSVIADNFSFTVAPIPLPPALYLFGSGLLGLVGVARKKAALHRAT